MVFNKDNHTPDNPLWGRFLHYLWLKRCYVQEIRSVRTYKNTISNDLNNGVKHQIESQIRQGESRLCLWRDSISINQKYLLGEITINQLYVAEIDMNRKHPY